MSDVLLVVGDKTSLTAGDTYLQTLLATTLGHTVTLASDEEAEVAQGTYAAAVLAESCSSGNLGSKYKTWTAGVLAFENGVYDDLDLSSSPSSTGIDNWDVNTVADLDGGHGGTNVVMFSSDQVARRVSFTTGGLGAGAQVVATIQGGTYAVYFVYEAGAALSSGALAPGRRVAMGVNDADFGNLTADGADVVQDAVEWTINAGGGGGDETAPVLSSASATATGPTTADLGVTTDEGNGTLYAVVTTSSTSPSAAQIQAGTDHTDAGAAFVASMAVDSTGAKAINATGLAAETTYWAHFVHVDDASNASAVVRSLSFTTDATPAGLDTPTGLTLTAKYRGIGAAWNSVAGATGYKLYRDGVEVYDGAATSYDDWGTDHPNADPANDGGLDDATEYDYTVSAYDGDGESGPSAVVSETPNAGLLVTLSDSGGTFDPQTITLTEGVAIEQASTFDHATPGDYTVTATTDGGHDPVTFDVTIAASGGGTAPAIADVNWNGNTIKVTFDQPMATVTEAGYLFEIGGAIQIDADDIEAVSHTSGSDTAIFLTSVGLLAGQTATVTYNPATGDSVNLSGQELQAVTDGAAANDSAQGVVRLMLWRCDTDEPYAELQDESTIDTDSIGTTNLNVEAEVLDEVESVVFNLDGSDVMTQSTGALFLGGDTGSNTPNDYSFANGDHTLIVTPYSLDGAAGPAGTPLTINFTVTADLTPDIPDATTLDDGTVGVAYNEVVNVDSGDLPLTMTVSAGSLPSGLSLSKTGPRRFEITGTPSAEGTSNFTLRVVDIDGDVDTQAASITIAAAPAANLSVSVQGGSAVADGGSDDLGTIEEGTATARTYTLTNTGDADLTLGTVAVDAGLTVTTDPSDAVLAPDETATLAVSVDDVDTNRNGMLTVTVPSDDADSPYTWDVLFTVGDSTAPAQPTGLDATAGNGQVTLTWTDPADTDLASIRIYRGTTSGNLSLLDAVSPGIETYVDPNAPNDIEHFYTVASVDDASPANVSAQTAEVSATPAATPAVSAQSMIYWNPITGDDTNSGTSRANALKSVSAVNAAVAAAGSGTTVRVSCQPATGAALDTLLQGDWFDASLLVGDGVSVVGDDDERVPLVGYKQITAGNWSPVAGSANVYKAPSAADAVPWYLEDDSDLGSLRWYTPVTAASWAAAASTVNGTPGSYWQGPDPDNGNAETLFLHPFDSTDPRVDGRRHVATHAGSSLDVMVRLTGDESVVSNLALYGMGGWDCVAGSATWAAYHLRVDAARNALVQDVTASHSTWHCLGAIDQPAMAGAGIKAAVFRNLRVSNCRSSGPMVLYVAEGRQGGSITIDDADFTTAGVTLGSSAGTAHAEALFGHTGGVAGSFAHLRVTDADFGAGGGIRFSDDIVRSVVLEQVTGGTVETYAAILSATGCDLEALPRPMSAACVAIVNRSLIAPRTTPTSPFFAAYRQQGTLAVRDTYFTAERCTTGGTGRFITRNSGDGNLHLTLERCTFQMLQPDGVGSGFDRLYGFDDVLLASGDTLAVNDCVFRSPGTSLVNRIDGSSRNVDWLNANVGSGNTYVNETDRTADLEELYGVDPDSPFGRVPEAPTSLTPISGRLTQSAVMRVVGSVSPLLVQTDAPGQTLSVSAMDSNNDAIALGAVTDLGDRWYAIAAGEERDVADVYRVTVHGAAESVRFNLLVLDSPRFDAAAVRESLGLSEPNLDAQLDSIRAVASPAPTRAVI